VDKVTLGKTGLEVSRLALGGLFVASLFNERRQAVEAVRHAVRLGINYIDTAPTYGNSEEVLGEALKGIDEPLILSTKLGGRPEPFDPKDKNCLAASVEESLRLLGRQHIDILMIHEPDRPGQYDWWTDWRDVNGPVLDLLDDLKARGVIRFTGLGGTTAYEMAHLIRSGKFDVVLTAFNYCLLWREAEIEVIPAAREQGMGIIVGSALQQGALARRFDDQIGRAHWLSPPRREQFRALYDLVDECGLPLPELAFRFVLSNPDIHTVLMGAGSREEVAQNVASAERGALPEDILERLDEIAAMVPFRPFEEPFGLGGRLANPESYTGPGPAR